MRDNTDKAPATVVTELLAYLNASYKNVAGQNLLGQDLSDNVALSVLQHPLQPFSKRYFDQSDQKLHNFKPLWFEAASTERKNVTFIDGAESRPLSESTTPTNMALEEPSGRVAVGQLTDYFIRPSQHYLLEQLQVRPAYAEDDLQDTEQFDLNGLEQWSVDQSVLEYGRVMPKTEVKRTLDARGLLPQGCLLYTSPSPRDKRQSRMPSSA